MLGVTGNAARDLVKATAAETSVASLVSGAGVWEQSIAAQFAQSLQVADSVGLAASRAFGTWMTDALRLPGLEHFTRPSPMFVPESLFATGVLTANGQP